MRFHWQYPEARISLYHLRQLYREVGIRKKTIRQAKSIPPQQQLKINEEAKVALQEVINYESQGYKIVYVDEFCVTKSTIPSHDWSRKRHYLRIDYRTYHRKTFAAVGAISLEEGVELIEVFDRSVDSAKFIQFLIKIRQQ